MTTARTMNVESNGLLVEIKPPWRRLALVTSGIFSCYLYYGILQEALFTGAYLGPTFCLVTACITNVMVARLWQFVDARVFDDYAPLESRRPLPHKLLFATAGAYVLAMTCSNEAIPFVSYPVAVLAKSCKLIPTMLVGQLVEHRLYSRLEWTSAAFISTGIALFHWSRIHMSSSPNSNATFGMVLLLISLAMDGILSSCQNFLKTGPRSKRAPNAMETMLFVNLYALFYLIPLSYISGQWYNGLADIFRRPGLAQNVALLNLTVGVGQIFIFLSIHWFTPVLTTTITTTRKFITILLSVWKFGHAFTVVQWFAISLVFCGLYVAIFGQGRPKLKVE
jgi:UDP-galactose transporter B1